MTTETVTPNFVNNSKEGSHFGSIKVGTRYYGFDVRKYPASTFAKGVPVTIEYTVKEQDDRTFYNIQKVTAAPQNSQAAQANGADFGKPYSGRMSPEESDRITRLAIAKSCLEAGNKTLADAESWLAWVLHQPQPMSKMLQKDDGYDELERGAPLPF